MHQNSVSTEGGVDVGLWIIIMGVFLLDQFSKFLVISFLELGDSFALIPGFFRITYTENPGAAFGILAYRTNFFLIITLILLFIIVVLLIKVDKKYYLLKVGLALQLGGALGNFVDRIRTGYVVDFFDFAFWPIFNVADVAIVAGVVILILFVIKEPDEEKENVF